MKTHGTWMLLVGLGLCSCSSPGARSDVVQAEFHSLGTGVHLDGVAELKEQQDGVDVELKLQHGTPGHARLSVEDRHCGGRNFAGVDPTTEAEKRGATPSVLMNDSLPGSIEIHPNGQANFTTSLPHTTLDPKAERSLAGRSPVTSQARQVNTGMGGRLYEAAVACAEVPGKG